MKKELLKAAARVAAPAVTSAVFRRQKSPVKRAADWASGQVMGSRRRSSSMGSTALKGLGAAAVAVPVGMWLGRMLKERSRPESRG